MIVRRLDEAEGSEREVTTAGKWASVRLLLKEDSMGFSFHVTTIYAGVELPTWYKNHLEAVYCLEGRGEVEVSDTGRTFEVRPGTLYALDQHDKHVLRAKEDLTLVCVFNPPVVGGEKHNAHGGYDIPD